MGAQPHVLIGQNGDRPHSTPRSGRGSYIVTPVRIRHKVVGHVTADVQGVVDDEIGEAAGIEGSRARSYAASIIGVRLNVRGDILQVYGTPPAANRTYW